MMRDEWNGCYNDSWMGDIVPEAFSHPAKFSRGLIYRIYQHAKEMGWVKTGDVCLDVFGGCALGGLDAMSMGLQWIGIELEEKFVKLGEQNIELWNRQLRGWHNLGTARILQGDSRKIKDMIEKADLICSSPPYAESITGQPIGQGEKSANDRYNRLKKAGYDAHGILTPGRRAHGNLGVMEHYGSTPGNLANMKEGDIDCVISSPPFSSMLAKEKSDFTKGRERGRYSNKSVRLDYGTSPGQLGSMKEGSVDAVISSPPYEDVVKTGEGTGATTKNRLNPKASSQAFYSKSDNNLGNQSGDTFWEASLEIVQGCYDLLKPEGHAIFVLKDYIKAGKRVPFSQNWASLCESIGFEIVCWHQAMLVKEHGVQITLENKEETIITERKSFFRRDHETKKMATLFWSTLNENEQTEFIEWASKKVETFSERKVLIKAQVRAFKVLCLDDTPYRDERNIDWEDVLCMRKGGIK